MDDKINKTWILLRGLTREAQHWGGLIEQLHRSFPDSQFYPIDLPGTGEYYQQTSPFSIYEITDFVRQQATDKGYLNSKAYLLAFSLGGMTAWDWLQRYSDDIAGGVLINISLAGINPFYHRLKWQCYLPLLRLANERNVFTRELQIVQLTSNDDEANAQKTAEAWTTIQKMQPVSLGNFIRQLLAAVRFQPTLTIPDRPLLLLNSLGDKLVSPSCSDEIGKRFSLPIATHPWAGHDICLDDPSWVIHQLHEFFYTKT